MHLSCDKMLRIYSTIRDEKMSNKVYNPIIDALIMVAPIHTYVI